MSDTPITDEAMLGDESVGLRPTVKKWDEAVEFARTLERQLAALRADNATLYDSVGLQENTIVQLKRELERAQEQLRQAREALKALYELVETGDLERFTGQDGDSQCFLKQGIRIVSALKLTQAALTSSPVSEGQEGKTIANPCNGCEYPPAACIACEALKNKPSTPPASEKEPCPTCEKYGVEHCGKHNHWPLEVPGEKEQAGCLCSEINARHCPVHQEKDL